MAMLWKYHKDRANRVNVVPPVLGKTQGELEAALYDEAPAATVEEAVPDTAKPARGRNTRAGASAPAEG